MKRIETKATATETIASYEEFARETIADTSLADVVNGNFAASLAIATYAVTGEGTKVTTEQGSEVFAMEGWRIIEGIILDLNDELFA